MAVDFQVEKQKEPEPDEQARTECNGLSEQKRIASVHLGPAQVLE